MVVIVMIVTIVMIIVLMVAIMATALDMVAAAIHSVPKLSTCS